MRVREGGSESGRERGKFVQKPSEVPTKVWEHETRLISLHFMCLSHTMFS